MGSKACIARLQKEYKAILKEPVPQITAHPAPNNLLDWHYVLEGPKDSDFEGGCYHGKVTFPHEYPFKPPSIVMLTPNGRFAPNTKLCLSMSNFHPESWNPLWSVSTILTGLLSFMLETQHTTGAISSTKEEKRRLARQSLAYNARNPTFRKLFPEWAQKLEHAAVVPAPGSHPQQPQQQPQQPQPQQQEKQQQQVDAAQAEGQQAQLQPGGAPAAPQVAPLAAGAVPAARPLQGGVGGQWSSYALGAAAVVAAAAAATAMLTLE
ncbi:Ubiquitin-conjugating enzyme E2 34 [Chlorella vulgaris]